MPVQVSCPNCQKKVLVPDGAAGKRIRCGGCDSVSRIAQGADGNYALTDTDVSEARVVGASGGQPPPPPAAAAATTPCPQCGAEVTLNEQFCTGCGAEIGAETKDTLEQKAAVLAQRQSTRVRQQKRREQQRARKVGSAATVVLVMAILFAVFGTIMGFVQKSTADQAHRNIAGYADDEELELEGEVWTAGELREQIDAEVLIVFVSNYILALIMLGLYFWARKSPLPALITALCVYLALWVMNAVLDPTTIAQGLLLKVIFIALLVSGIKAALAERAAMQRGHPAA